MARTQFTFTFTNAQPGADVHFSAPVYPDASTSTPDGPTLVLSSANAVSVWADAGFLVAVSVDGNGNEISATATAGSPTVSTDSGTAGTSPFGTGGSAPVGVGDFMTWTREGATDGDSASFDFTVDVKESAGTSIVVEDDADFISNYGYALPKVTVAGAFSIGFGAIDLTSAATEIACGANLVDSTGNSYLEPHDDVGLFFHYSNYTVNGPRGVGGTHTVVLPAGAHIDLSFQCDVDPSSMALFIQKVG